jgi:transcription initiation factor TFIID subunit 1
VKGDSKYFIREIKNFFVIGQSYPVTEVPGPHSRKITNTIKYRLQIIAFKLLKKSPGERLKISRLMKYFPDQNELQMRQRLKVGRLITDHRHTLLNDISRNSWSITGEGHIKGFGG